MVFPPYIQLLINEGTLTSDQVNEAEAISQKKKITAERALILLEYLTRTQLIDAIDRVLNKDSEHIEDTESGVMQLRAEIQTLTGVARIAKMNGAKP